MNLVDFKDILPADVDADIRPREKGAPMPLSNWLMPQHPFGLLMMASTGKGKTHTLMNMLLQPWGLKYDRLHVVATTLFQPFYVNLRGIFDHAREKAIEKEVRRLVKKGIDENEVRVKVTEANPPAANFYSSLHDFDYGSLDHDYINLIILDDLVFERDTESQKKIENMYSKGRHSTTSIIFLSQSVSRINVEVRHNSTAFMVWKTTLNNIRTLHRSIETDLEYAELAHIISGLRKHEFFFYDMKAPALAMYRKGFLTALIPRSIEEHIKDD